MNWDAIGALGELVGAAAEQVRSEATAVMGKAYDSGGVGEPRRSGGTR